MAKVPIDFAVNAKGNAPTFFGKLETQLKGLRKGDFSQGMEEVGKLLKGGGALAAFASTFSAVADYTDRIKENLKSSSELTRTFAKNIAAADTIHDIPLMGRLAKFVNVDMRGKKDWAELVEQEKLATEHVKERLAVYDQIRDVQMELKANAPAGIGEGIDERQSRYIASMTSDFGKKQNAIDERIKKLKQEEAFFFEFFDDRTMMQSVQQERRDLEKLKGLNQQRFDQQKQSNLDKLILDEWEKSLGVYEEATKRYIESEDKRQAKLEAADVARMERANVLPEYFNQLATAAGDFAAGMFNNQRSAGSLIAVEESRFGTGVSEAADERLRIEQNQLDSMQRMQEGIGKLLTAINNLAQKMIPVTVVGSLRR